LGFASSEDFFTARFGRVAMIWSVISGFTAWSISGTAKKG
jgi:hypothetical protein